MSSHKEYDESTFVVQRYDRHAWLVIFGSIVSWIAIFALYMATKAYAQAADIKLWLSIHIPIELLYTVMPAFYLWARRYDRYVSLAIFSMILITVAHGVAWALPAIVLPSGENYAYLYLITVCYSVAAGAFCLVFAAHVRGVFYAFQIPHSILLAYTFSISQIQAMHASAWLGFFFLIVTAGLHEILYYHVYGEIKNRWLSDATKAELNAVNESLNFQTGALLDKTQQLSLSEIKYKRFVNNISEIIYQTDMNGKWTFLNPAWVTLTGYSIAESLGRLSVGFSHPDDLKKSLNALLPILSGDIESTRIEVRYLHKSGELRWGEIWATSAKDENGQTLGATGTINDISVRKAAEETLLKAKESAEIATREKSRFLAVISHEIRTPMNGVLGMAQLLMETDLNDEQKDYLKTLYNSGQNLLTIINDILDFSKIEAGKLSVEQVSFDLYQAVDDVCDILMPQFIEKNVDLMVDFQPNCPRYVLGDVGRVRQILLNFVSNAIKFTEKGFVLISISANEIGSEGAVFYLSVKDTGIGIEQDCQDKLFQQFYQADFSSTRRHGGTGLGLAISKSLAELMGGYVGVESKPLVGSNFYAVIPMRVQQHENYENDFRNILCHRSIYIIDGVGLSRKSFFDFFSHYTEDVYDFNDITAFMDGFHGSSKFRAIFFINNFEYFYKDINPFIDKMKSSKIFENCLFVVFKNGSDSINIPKSNDKNISIFQVNKPFVWGKFKQKLMDIFADYSDLNVFNENADSDKYNNFFKGGIRVLLAEDNVVNQKIIAASLKQMGCHVDVVNNGIEAVRMFLQFSYDIVLMDCQMPEMDGYLATQEIRRLQPLSSNAKELPIIALMANAAQEEVDKCLQEGMNDFLLKPVSVDDLYEVLAQWIQVS
jgi:two-component system sensor histidine kinase/response regulator